jgi:hypothetical protein
MIGGIGELILLERQASAADALSQSITQTL